MHRGDRVSQCVQILAPKQINYHLCSLKYSITISREKNIKWQKRSQENVPTLIQVIVNLPERKMAVATYILQNLAKSQNAETKDVHCDIQKHADMAQNVKELMFVSLNIM